jgi:mycothiol synthase
MAGNPNAPPATPVLSSGLKNTAARKGAHAMTLRSYRDDADLDALLAIARAAVTANPQTAVYHPGDVIWQRFQWPTAAFDPARRIFLWQEPDQPPSAFVWLDGAASIQGNPVWLASPDRVDALLAALESHQRATGATVLETEAVAGDAEIEAALSRAGFTRGEVTLVRFEQALATPLAPAALPAGWRIEAVTRETQLGQRVALHREVWSPSRVTLAAYLRLRADPRYDPNLDLVAINDLGDLGAYCICWHDATTRTGLFEPVGASNPYRRLGLSKAVLIEGLRRLRERGATHAYVNTGNVDHPPKFSAQAAQALYHAAGFAIVQALRTWHKAL